MRSCDGDIYNPRHAKPQTHQTQDKHNQDTPNLRHIKPQTKNIGLSTTYIKLRGKKSFTEKSENPIYFQVFK